jgi:hypothetical protein
MSLLKLDPLSLLRRFVVVSKSSPLKSNPCTSGERNVPRRPKSLDPDQLPSIDEHGGANRNCVAINYTILSGEVFFIDDILFFRYAATSESGADSERELG